MTGELERRTNWSTSRFLHSEQAVPLDKDPASELRSARSRLFALALIYAGFIVYGSLLPFEFRALPLGDAWQKFLETPYLALGVMKRADWVANCVLYAPIGFLLSGALSSSAIRTGRAFGYLLALLLGTAVAIGVEFTQLYFPRRTVSLNDLGAEIVGTLIGVALWASQGPKLLNLMRSIAEGGTAAIRAAIVIYLAGYFVLAMFPYDFLISWTEIEWKLASDGIGFVIAGDACESGLRCTVKFVIEIAASMPLGVLIALMRPRTAATPWRTLVLQGLLIGFAVEFLQVFIASGIVQGASVITRAVGLVAGYVGFRIAAQLPLAGLRPWMRPAALVGCIPYAVLVIALSGWRSGGWLGIEEGLDRLASINFLPFYYHYFTTEQKAMFSAVTRAILFAPAGLLAWMWVAGRVRSSTSYAGAWAAGIGAAALAFVTETGLLFFRDTRPDPTNIVIAFFAASAVFVIAEAFSRWTRAAPQTSGVQRPPTPEPAVARAEPRPEADAQPAATAPASPGPLVPLPCHADLYGPGAPDCHGLAPAQASVYQ